MEKLDLFSFEPIKNSISKFLFDEEGNITRNKVLQIGSMLILMGLILCQDAFAAHRSHSSHSSHSSHKSHSSSSGGHSSHVSHVSHTSSTTHSSHSSSTPSHSSTPTPSPTPTVVIPAKSSVPVPSAPFENTLNATLTDSVIVVPAVPETPKV